MKCAVCDSTDKWKNVSKWRMKKVDEKNVPIDMCVCTGCGFVSYPNKYKSEDEIKKYYKNEYRPAPQAIGLFTGERKLQYHSAFLHPIFDEWQKIGLTKPVVGEIGSAYGMVLNWVRQCFPEADIHGTELTETYKRVAYQEYGIKLEDDFDMTKKYDLIISYHVLEHQMDPDIMLKKYAECLKDHGVFYLSAPIWFRQLANSGAPGFDLDWYWAPDHINSWSDEHLDHIIAKAGLEVIHKDTAIYGNTYVLKKAPVDKVVKMPAFDAAKYEKMIETIYRAWTLVNDHKAQEAIKIWPNYPYAWISTYEFNRQNFHKKQSDLDIFLKDAMAACPNGSEIYTFAADVLSRYERYDDSIVALEESLKKKPNNAACLLALSNCYRMKALKHTDVEKRTALLKKSIGILRFILNITSENFAQIITWIYHDEALIPVPEKSSGAEIVHDKKVELVEG